MWTYLKSIPKEEVTAFLTVNKEFAKSSIPLSEVHPHERDKRISRNDATHTYTLDGRDLKISGTGFKALFTPKFDPEQRIRQMFQRSGSSGSRYSSLRGSDYDGMTALEISRLWEATAVRGTSIHAVIENFYNWYHEIHDKLTANEIRRLLYNTAKELGFDMPIGMIYLLGGQLHSFHKVWKIYRVEMQIFDEELGLAGTVDAVYYRDVGEKRMFLVDDWKSRSNVKITQSEGNCYYPFDNLKANSVTEYQLQLSLYADIYKRKYDMEVEGITAVAILNDAIRLINLKMLDMKLAYQVYLQDLRKRDIFLRGVDEVSGMMFPEEKEPEFISSYSLKEEEFLYDEDERRAAFEQSSSKRRKH